MSFMLCGKEMCMWSLGILLHLNCAMVQAMDSLPSLLPSSFPLHLLRMQMIDFSESICGELSFSFLSGTSYSPQENSHNHSALHSSNSHSSNPSNNPSKTSDAVSICDWFSSMCCPVHAHLIFIILFKTGSMYFVLEFSNTSLCFINAL